MVEANLEKNEKYISALRFGWLTPLYDPILRWVMREEPFKKQLVRQAQIKAGQNVLDLGCGTATLTILIKQTHPEAEVTGLDGDPRVLAIGRAKVAKAGTAIILDQGMSFRLPYSDESFDRVLSSLLFHHLNTKNKQRTLDEFFSLVGTPGFVSKNAYMRTRRMARNQTGRIVYNLISDGAAERRIC